MALGRNIEIDVGARGFADDIVSQVNDAQRRIQPLNLKLDDKGFRQPLGRITGDLSEFQNSLDASVARTLAFGAAVGVINSVANAFKGMISSATEVEKKLTDVNVILNLNSQNLRSFSNSLFEVARQTGTTFDTVSEAAVELARQGLGAEETLKRINDAMILTRLSGMDAAKSVQTLTAAINGFGSAALDTTEIVNKLATVDAAFAVSTDDLANALSRAGATAQAAKVSMDELLGAVTSVQQTTARGGAVIGNAFKSIFTRIQRSSVREQLESIGVATSDAAGNIRNAMAILKDYAQVYKTLSDGQRAYTDELVAGVFQINNLRALVKDLGSGFSIYERAMSQSANATDEATRRNAELDKTMAALMNKSIANVKQLAAAIGGIVASPAVKNLLTIFNSISDALVKALDPEKGSKVIKGMFGAIGKFISGPGLLLVGAAFIKLFKFITGQSLKAVKEVFKIKSATSQVADTEAKITAILRQNEQLYKSISNEALSHKQKEDLVLQVINAENAALARQQQMIANLARSRTVQRSVSGMGAARGFIPNLANDVKGAIASEKEAIRAGVGGASRGAQPKVLKNFPTGKGKKETFVANTDEVVVPNYGGGSGSAILNQDMIAELGGVPKDAKPVARGFIPSFAKLKPPSEERFFVPKGGSRAAGATIDDKFYAMVQVGKAIENTAKAKRVQMDAGGISRYARLYTEELKRTKNPFSKEILNVPDLFLKNQDGDLSPLTIAEVTKELFKPRYKFEKLQGPRPKMGAPNKEAAFYASMFDGFIPNFAKSPFKDGKNKGFWDYLISPAFMALNKGQPPEATWAKNNKTLTDFISKQSRSPAPTGSWISDIIGGGGKGAGRVFKNQLVAAGMESSFTQVQKILPKLSGGAAGLNNYRANLGTLVQQLNTPDNASRWSDDSLQDYIEARLDPFKIGGGKMANKTVRDKFLKPSGGFPTKAQRKAYDNITQDRDASNEIHWKIGKAFERTLGALGGMTKNPGTEALDFSRLEKRGIFIPAEIREAINYNAGTTFGDAEKGDGHGSKVMLSKIINELSAANTLQRISGYRPGPAGKFNLYGGRTVATHPFVDFVGQGKDKAISSKIATLGGALATVKPTAKKNLQNLIARKAGKGSYDQLTKQEKELAKATPFSFTYATDDIDLKNLEDPDIIEKFNIDGAYLRNSGFIEENKKLKGLQAKIAAGGFIPNFISGAQWDKIAQDYMNSGNMRAVSQLALDTSGVGAIIGAGSGNSITRSGRAPSLPTQGFTNLFGNVPLSALGVVGPDGAPATGGDLPLGQYLMAGKGTNIQAKYPMASVYEAENKSAEVSKSIGPKLLQAVRPGLESAAAAIYNKILPGQAQGVGSEQMDPERYLSTSVQGGLLEGAIRFGSDALAGEFGVADAEGAAWDFTAGGNIPAATKSTFFSGAGVQVADAKRSKQAAGKGPSGLLEKTLRSVAGGAPQSIFSQIKGQMGTDLQAAAKSIEGPRGPLSKFAASRAALSGPQGARAKSAFGGFIPNFVDSLGLFDEEENPHLSDGKTQLEGLGKYNEVYDKAGYSGRTLDIGYLSSGDGSGRKMFKTLLDLVSNAAREGNPFTEIDAGSVVGPRIPSVLVKSKKLLDRIRAGGKDIPFMKVDGFMNPPAALFEKLGRKKGEQKEFGKDIIGRNEYKSGDEKELANSLRQLGLNPESEKLVHFSEVPMLQRFAGGFVPNYATGRTKFDKDSYTTYGGKLNIRSFFPKSGSASIGNLFKDVIAAAQAGTPYSSIEAGEIVGPRIPKMLVTAKKILDKKRAAGLKQPRMPIDGFMEPYELFNTLGRNKRWFEAEKKIAKEQGREFKPSQPGTGIKKAPLKAKYVPKEEQALISSLRQLGLRVDEKDANGGFKEFDRYFLKNMPLFGGGFARGFIPNAVRDVANERGGFWSPADNASSSADHFEKTSYARHGTTLDLQSFFPKSGALAINTLFKDVIQKAKEGQPYRKIAAGEIVGPRIPKMILKAKRFIDKARAGGLAQPLMDIEGYFEPTYLLDSLQANKNIYDKAKKEAEESGTKFQASKPGHGPGLLKKSPLSKSYMPKEEEQLIRTFKELGVPPPYHNSWQAQASGSSGRRVLLKSLPLFARGFAGGFIPNFLDVYRGVKVGRGDTPNVDDVFKAGESSRGKFRPSEIYSIPQLQDYLQAHAQSALGTGLVSSSTSRKTAESFATTSDPTKRGVVGRKSMSHKRMYNPRKVEQLVKFLMTRREMSERDAVQWFVKQAQNKPIGFDVKRWLNELDAKQFGGEQEIAILNKSSFDPKDYARGFIPNFADALEGAIVREKEALAAQGSDADVYVDQDKRVKGPENPMGLLVANTRDEPLSGSQGVDRAIKGGMNPRNMGKSEGFIPSFAEPGGLNPQALQGLFESVIQRLLEASEAQKEAAAWLKASGEELFKSGDQLGAAAQQQAGNEGRQSAGGEGGSAQRNNLESANVLVQTQDMAEKAKQKLKQEFNELSAAITQEANEIDPDIDMLIDALEDLDEVGKELEKAGVSIKKGIKANDLQQFDLGKNRKKVQERGAARGMGGDILKSNVLKETDKMGSAFKRLGGTFGKARKGLGKVVSGFEKASSWFFYVEGTLSMLSGALEGFGVKIPTITDGIGMLSDAFQGIDRDAVEAGQKRSDQLKKEIQGITKAQEATDKFIASADKLNAAIDSGNLATAGKQLQALFKDMQGMEGIDPSKVSALIDSLGDTEKFKEAQENLKEAAEGSKALKEAEQSLVDLSVSISELGDDSEEVQKLMDESASTFTNAAQKMMNNLSPEQIEAAADSFGKVDLEAQDAYTALSQAGPVFDQMSDSFKEQMKTQGKSAKAMAKTLQAQLRYTAEMNRLQKEYERLSRVSTPLGPVLDRLSKSMSDMATTASQASAILFDAAKTNAEIAKLTFESARVSTDADKAKADNVVNKEIATQQSALNIDKIIKDFAPTIVGAGAQEGGVIKGRGPEGKEENVAMQNILAGVADGTYNTNDAVLALQDTLKNGTKEEQEAAQKIVTAVQEENRKLQGELIKIDMELKKQLAVLDAQRLNALKANVISTDNLRAIYDLRDFRGSSAGDSELERRGQATILQNALAGIKAAGAGGTVGGAALQAQTERETVLANIASQFKAATGQELKGDSVEEFNKQIQAFINSDALGRLGDDIPGATAKTKEAMVNAALAIGETVASAQRTIDAAGGQGQAGYKQLSEAQAGALKIDSANLDQLSAAINKGLAPSIAALLGISEEQVAVFAKTGDQAATNAKESIRINQENKDLQATNAQALDEVKQAMKTVSANMAQTSGNLEDATERLDKASDALARATERLKAIPTAKGGTATGDDKPAKTASGFVPNFTPDPLSRAVGTERALGGKPVVDSHPSVGIYVRDALRQPNFAAVRRDHPEGMQQAIANSAKVQEASRGFIPNFAAVLPPKKSGEDVAKNMLDSHETIAAGLGALRPQHTEDSKLKGDYLANFQHYIKGYYTGSGGLVELKDGDSHKFTVEKKAGLYFKNLTKENILKSAFSGLPRKGSGPEFTNALRPRVQGALEGGKQGVEGLIYGDGGPPQNFLNFLDEEGSGYMDWINFSDGRSNFESEITDLPWYWDLALGALDAVGWITTALAAIGAVATLGAGTPLVAGAIALKSAGKAWARKKISRMAATQVGKKLSTGIGRVQAAGQAVGQFGGKLGRGTKDLAGKGVKWGASKGKDFTPQWLSKLMGRAKYGYKSGATGRFDPATAGFDEKKVMRELARRKKLGPYNKKENLAKIAKQEKDEIAGFDKLLEKGTIDQKKYNFLVNESKGKYGKLRKGVNAKAKKHADGITQKEYNRLAKQVKETAEKAKYGDDGLGALQKAGLRRKELNKKVDVGARRKGIEEAFEAGEFGADAKKALLKQLLADAKAEPTWGGRAFDAIAGTVKATYGLSRVGDRVALGTGKYMKGVLGSGVTRTRDWLMNNPDTAFKLMTGLKYTAGLSAPALAQAIEDNRVGADQQIVNAALNEAAAGSTRQEASKTATTAMNATIKQVSAEDAYLGVTALNDLIKTGQERMALEKGSGNESIPEEDLLPAGFGANLNQLWKDGTFDEIAAQFGVADPQYEWEAMTQEAMSSAVKSFPMRALANLQRQHPGLLPLDLFLHRRNHKEFPGIGGVDTEIQMEDSMVTGFTHARSADAIARVAQNARGSLPKFMEMLSNVSGDVGQDIVGAGAARVISGATIGSAYHEAVQKILDGDSPMRFPKALEDTVDEEGNPAVSDRPGIYTKNELIDLVAQFDQAEKKAQQNLEEAKKAAGEEEVRGLQGLQNKIKLAGDQKKRAQEMLNIISPDGPLFGPSGGTAPKTGEESYISNPRYFQNGKLQTAQHKGKPGTLGALQGAASGIMGTYLKTYGGTGFAGPSGTVEKVKGQINGLFSTGGIESGGIYDQFVENYFSKDVQTALALMDPDQWLSTSDQARQNLMSLVQTRRQEQGGGKKDASGMVVYEGKGTGENKSYFYEDDYGCWNKLTGEGGNTPADWANCGGTPVVDQDTRTELKDLETTNNLVKLEKLKEKKAVEDEVRREEGEAARMRELRYAALLGLHEEQVRKNKGDIGDLGKRRESAQALIENTWTQMSGYYQRLQHYHNPKTSPHIKGLNSAKKIKENLTRAGKDTSAIDAEIAHYTKAQKLVDEAWREGKWNEKHVNNLVDFLYQIKGDAGKYVIPGRKSSKGILEVPIKSDPAGKEKFAALAKELYLDVPGLPDPFTNIPEEVKEKLMEKSSQQGQFSPQEYLDYDGYNNDPNFKEAQKAYAKISWNPANPNSVKDSIFVKEFGAAATGKRFELLKSLGLNVTKEGKAPALDKKSLVESLASSGGQFGYLMKSYGESKDAAKKETLLQALERTSGTDRTQEAPLGMWSFLAPELFDELASRKIAVAVGGVDNNKVVEANAFNGGEVPALYTAVREALKGEGTEANEGDPENLKKAIQAVNAAASNANLEQLKTNASYIFSGAAGKPAEEIMYDMLVDTTKVRNFKDWDAWMTAIGGNNKDNPAKPMGGDFLNLESPPTMYGPIGWNGLSLGQQKRLNQLKPPKGTMSDGKAWKSAFEQVFGDSIYRGINEDIEALYRSGDKHFYADLLGLKGQDYKDQIKQYIESVEVTGGGLPEGLSRYAPFGYKFGWGKDSPINNLGFGTIANAPRKEDLLTTEEKKELKEMKEMTGIQQLAEKNREAEEKKWSDSKWGSTMSGLRQLMEVGNLFSMNAGGFIPNFSAVAGEMAASREAGYTKAVTASQVKTMNIPGQGKTAYNTQETVVKAKGMRQPFIIPPSDSKAASGYGQRVEKKFGFNPYSNAAEGFVPNFAENPQVNAFMKSLEDFSSSLNANAVIMGTAAEALQKAADQLSQSEDRELAPAAGGADSSALADAANQMTSGLTTLGQRLEVPLELNDANITAAMGELSRSLSNINIGLEVTVPDVSVNVNGGGTITTEIQNAFNNNLKPFIVDSINKMKDQITKDVNDGLR